MGKQENNQCEITSVNVWCSLPPQRGPQPDREASPGQDEQLHRRARISGAHLQRHVPQARQADCPTHGCAAYEDTQRLGGTNELVTRG